MKTPIILFIVSLSLLATPNIRADEAVLAGILKERDATLSKLLALKELYHANGAAAAEEVDAARVALWTFRRDTAKSNAEKIKLQEAIANIYEKQLEFIKLKQTQGFAGDMEILIATDALLQAKQTLEELRLASTAQASQTSNLALPKAGLAGKNQINSNGVTIVIKKDNSILFNGKNASRNQLAQLLSQIKTISRDIPVLVSMDENISTETLAFVMDACRKQGLNKISLQTQ